MPYQGILNFDDQTKKVCTISLREAAMKEKMGRKIKCNCSSTCLRRRCSCRTAGLLCSSHCHPKNSKCLNTDDDIPKVGPNRKRKLELRAVQKAKKVKIPNHPDDKDLKSISGNAWLEDVHIDAANHLLMKQFPKLAGLYPTVYGQDLSFPVTTDPFVQILHVGGNHWATVAGVSPSLVHVYDSIYDYTMEDTRMQIAAIMGSTESTITLKIHKTQVQQGSNDCGVFAIAYATDLAHGNDPASFRYKQEVLRTHFMDCLEKKTLSPFPNDICHPGRPKSEVISVYCSCRLPDNGQERMARCSNCQEWYHQSCEGIAHCVFTDNSVWICTRCTN